jgi:hypothetical protein
MDTDTTRNTTKTNNTNTNTNSTKEIFNNTIKTIKDVTSNVTDKVSQSSAELTKTLTGNSKASANSKDSQTDSSIFTDSSNKFWIFIGLIVVVVLCIFVSYGLYRFISYSIFNKSRIVIEGTSTPILCNQMNKFSITKFNKTGNGKRRSYTFWIYIHDMNKYSGSYKHVFHIGSSNDIRRSAPYVFLDSHENRMYIRFGSVNEDSFDENLSSVQNLTVSQLNKFMEQGIEIPYVPIQRWVHIAVVINENANGGSIVGYVDGDISKVVTTNDMIKGSSNKIKVSNLDLDIMGDLYAGGSWESPNGPGFSGLLSKVTSYNYDLNNKDVYEDYNRGPLDGFLAASGLANYGLRSPVYKIV